MTGIPVEFTLNGQPQRVAVDAPELLVEALRERCGIRGVRVGCETGDCGACTVLLDGEVTKTCLRLAPSVDGADVVTIEGLGDGESLHPVQEAFVETNAFQCGFCLPGMLLSSVDVLEKQPHADRAAVCDALSGNLCRCAGYVRMVEAVTALAEQGREPEVTQ